MSSSVVDVEDLQSGSSKRAGDYKKCDICRKADACYACPRCNRPYCSLRCYQDEVHADCSESFYRECVLEELTIQSKSGNPESRRRIQEVLVNIHEQSNDGLVEELDSDDELDEDDLAGRLQGVDLNDADAVWAQLSNAEQLEFKKLIQTGDVEDFLPDWDPWWVSKPVEELKDESNLLRIPDVNKDVPVFSDLCKSKPASCLPFNVANTVTGYVYCYRQFEGDLHSEPVEAFSVICRVAGSLRRKENYNTFSHAIAAVAAEAIAKDEASEDVMSLLKSDVEVITRTPLFLQAALSDILVLLHAALKSSKKPKIQKAGAFTRQFCSSESASAIPSTELKTLLKKVEFYVSWAKQFS